MCHGFLIDSQLDYTGYKFEMDFLTNGMEKFLVQPNVSPIKLAISSGGTVFVLSKINFYLFFFCSPQLENMHVLKDNIYS